VEERDDRVIDLAAYLRRKQEEEAEDATSRSVFSFWGGDGERARFALPLWRAAYLGGGLRAALVWQRNGATTDEPEGLVVLDLRKEPARIDFQPAAVASVSNADSAGTLGATSDGIAVYLGEGDARRWYMVVDDFDPAFNELSVRSQGDLLFLAGECAGLLFFRGLANGTGDEEP
jgi:hypothetical protein